MTDEQREVEKLVEQVLEHMKNDVGSVEFDKLSYLGHLENKVRRRMMTKGLITQPFANKSNLKTLTEYGWTFPGFDKERKEIAEKKELERKQIQSVIDTNESVKSLNTKTETFYTKQVNYNNIQKLLTLVIFLSAAVSAIVATCNYLYPKNSYIKIQLDTANHQLQFQRLENILKFHLEKDSVFERQIKDSLGLP